MSKWSEQSEWDRKTGSIGLSKERRARLREFADSIQPGMTKAEALYALIDKALPMDQPPAPPSQAEAFREVAERSASALERVAATLTPLERLISDEEGAGPNAAARPCLGARAWIDGALSRLGVRPKAQLALRLQWLSSSRAPGHPIELLFSVDRLRLDEREIDTSAAVMPALALRLPNEAPATDISLTTLLGRLALVCQPVGAGWTCALRSDPPSPASLVAFRC